MTERDKYDERTDKLFDLLPIARDAQACGGEEGTCFDVVKEYLRACAREAREKEREGLRLAECVEYLHENGDWLEKPLKAVKALRKPDAALRAVPNTVRQSIADVIVGLIGTTERAMQRNRDTDWLQQAAFQLLKEHGIQPSSRALLDAVERARKDQP